MIFLFLNYALGENLEKFSWLLLVGDETDWIIKLSAFWGMSWVGTFWEVGCAFGVNFVSYQTRCWLGKCWLSCHAFDVDLLSCACRLEAVDRNEQVQI